MRAPSGCAAGWGSRGSPGMVCFTADLGTRVCSDQVSQASGKCGVSLIDTSPLLHTMHWSWFVSVGHVQTRLAALTLGRVGEMLVARAAAGCASISRRAIETWKHLSSASYASLLGCWLLKVGTGVFGRL